MSRFTNVWKMMKIKLSWGLLLLGALCLMGSQKSFVQDPARLLTRASVQMVQEKNQRYQQTKAKPQLVVTTTQHLSRLNRGESWPAARKLVIAIGHQHGKQNVQLIVSTDLKPIFSKTVCTNLIAATAPQLRSQKKKDFNRGLQTLFKACSTLIDQKYGYPRDHLTLSETALNKLLHPRRLDLPIALLIVVGIGAVFNWQSGRRKNRG